MSSVQFVGVDDRLSRIESAVARLGERLDRIEAELAAATGADDRSSPGLDAARTDNDATFEGVDEPTDPSAQPLGTAADEATPTVPSAVFSFDPDVKVEQRAAPPPPRVADEIEDDSDDSPSGPPVRESSASNRNLEQLIGTRLTAIAGGVIVVLAAAWFAKLAFDSGWIGAIPPIVRALALAILGGTLVGTGIWFDRRFGRAAAVGLAIAGLGTLYVDGWAMGSVLGLLGPTGTLLALAVTATIGLLVTVRFDSRLVGGASLAAGGLAPYVAGGSASELGPWIYYTMLLAIGMVMPLVRARPFLHLRTVAFWIVIIASAPWWWYVITNAPPVMVMIYAAVWWMLVHGTSTAIAARGQDWRSSAALDFTSTGLMAIPIPIAVTAVGAGPGLLAPEGWTVAALAAASVFRIFQFGSGLTALGSLDEAFQRRERCLHRLSAVGWLEAGVLTLLAVALLLRGPALPLAWVVLGVGAALFARRTGLRRAVYFGATGALLGQFAASFVVLSAMRGPQPGLWLEGTPFQVFALPEMWVVPVAAIGIVMTAFAWPPPRPGKRSVGPSVVLGIGLLPWFVPIVFFGGVGWWSAMLVAPLVVTNLLARWRGGGATARLSAIWASLATPMLVVGLSIPMLAMVLPQEDLLGFPDEPGVLVRDWGGLGSTLMAVGLVFAVFLAALAGIATESGMVAAAPRSTTLVRRLFAELGPILGAVVVVVLMGGTSEAWPPLARVGLVGPVGAMLSAAAILSAHRRWPRLVDDGAASVAGVAITAVWLTTALAGAIGGDSDWRPESLGSAANLRTFTGLCLVVATVVAAVLARGLSGGATYRVMIGAAAILMLTVGSTIVFDLAGGGIESDLAVSVWWTIFAVGLVALGFRMDASILRRCGLALLAIGAFKFLTYDLREAATMVRIVSGLVIGLVLVGTSIMYVRFGSNGDTDAD